MKEQLQELINSVDNLADQVTEASMYEGHFGQKVPDSLYNIELQLGFLNDKFDKLNDSLEDIANAMKTFARMAVDKS